MNNEKVFLVPAENTIVRDPQTGEPLPVDGKEVVINNYWQRRLNDGDVTIRNNDSKKNTIKTGAK